MVIPTYWNFPGIILNDETYLLGQVSLFFYLPTTVAFSVAGIKLAIFFWSQVQIKGRGSGRNRVASHGSFDFSGAFAGVMKGGCVWQIPILPSGHWQFL